MIKRNIFETNIPNFVTENNDKILFQNFMISAHLNYFFVYSHFYITLLCTCTLDITWSIKYKN